MENRSDVGAKASHSRSGIDLGRDDVEELSPLVVGYAWVAKITAYSAEFAVLVWFGWFLDRTYGWSPWGILGGAAIGGVAFVAGLVATAKRLEDEEVRERLRHIKTGRGR